ncbi:Crp/Fnr family transcriptional regulator [Cyanobium sp. LEGE 06143]|uniref:Crp/Fnr family transcriptional regulator n=1 Tax=Cyanobium sp. LEGE 06143 TaxID=945727 RepID=UPI001882B900|nr:Crp/Fnr family transcriptional regulator [Cyanobium sp. LEGE 06143]MBE9173705.1 Crp/Fnr family transcriptional regulator [Cyanobium sp. LEGE 06143]
MTPNDSLRQADVLFQALGLLEPIGAEERRALRRLGGPVVRIGEGSYVSRHGDYPAASALLIEGFLCRQRLLEEGQRQIFSLHYPGDLAGFETLRLRLLDHDIRALTDCHVSYIPHGALESLMREYPGLAAALWKSALREGAVVREWMAGIGRRPALQRLAHLICEIFVRMRVLGRTSDDRFYLPLNQTDMADILGLSLVHVNRMAGLLRRSGLIEWRHQHMSISDWPQLRDLARFDPAYLQFHRPPLLT